MLFQILNKVWDWDKGINLVPISNIKVFSVKTTTKIYCSHNIIQKHALHLESLIISMVLQDKHDD